MKLSRLALTIVVLLAAAPALAREVADVNYPETVTVEGKTLKLNGAGLRKKFFIKVYAGALYLETNSTNVDEILKADQVKQVQMTFLRGVEKEKIVGAYKEGFENNSKEALPKLKDGIEKLNGLGDMKAGQVMTVTYVPGKGTTLAQKGGPTVTVEGKDFADALFRNWLGAVPADSGLKESMLEGK